MQTHGRLGRRTADSLGVGTHEEPMWSGAAAIRNPYGMDALGDRMKAHTTAATHASATNTAILR